MAKRSISLRVAPAKAEEAPSRRRARAPSTAPGRFGQTASRGAAGNLEMQRAVAGAEADRRTVIKFPHVRSIQSAIGTSIPGRAMYDPDACRRRGVPAFTDGSVTHFGTPTPGLHVAAHEATHQLQHAGHTNDAGMGAEGHAHSVASLIAAGGNPRPVLGDRGRPVASARRDYKEVSAAEQTATSQWIIGSDARVADTGLMVTSVSDRHVCYAEPSLIEAANLILRAKDSGVRLRAGGAGPSGSAPDGSGVKSTVQVIAQVRSATSNVFQMTAVAFSTRLNRLAAVVRSRTAAKGDSIGFVVRRCFQCSAGNSKNVSSNS